jgi:hypothetical protein
MLNWQTIINKLHLGHSKGRRHQCSEKILILAQSQSVISRYDSFRTDLNMLVNSTPGLLRRLFKILLLVLDKKSKTKNAL